MVFYEEWKDFAQCLNAPREIFFPKTGIRTQEKANIRAYCGPCAVRQECYDYAVKTEAVDGVWGGVYFGFRRGKQKMTNILEDKR